MFRINKFWFSKRKEFYEVVISGAGPSGSALALALQKSQYLKEKSVLLIDSQKGNFEFPSKKISDQRVVTLNNKSIGLLKSLEVWEQLDQSRLSYFDKMQVWEQNGDSHLNVQNQQMLGCIVENSHLVSASLKQLQNQKVVELNIPDQIVKINNDNFFVEIETNDRIIESRLLIGADGPNSFVRKNSNIHQYGWSYNQMGLVCTIQVDHNPKIAFQRFCGDSIIAFLPLFDNQYSVVYSSNLENYDFLQQMEDDQFIDHLNHIMNQQSTNQNSFFKSNQFQNPPQVIKICNKKLGFPLFQSQSKRYISNRIALIGDSAHQVHPLAGQGLNLGYNDTAFLANNIIKNLKVGNDFGLQLYLQDYESQAKLYNYAMATSLEFIKKSYQEQNSIFSFIRNNTISILQNIPIINQQIQNVAEGEYFHPSKYEWSN